MSIFQGDHALKIGGKRIPLGLLAIVATIGAALLVVRAMRSSRSTVSLGDVSGTSAFQAQLDQLTATAQQLQIGLGQLNAIQTTGQPISTPQTPSPPPGPPAPAPGPPPGPVVYDPRMSAPPDRNVYVGAPSLGHPLSWSSAAGAPIA